MSATASAPTQTVSNASNKLLAKLVRVYHAVDHVEKSGRNNFQNYSYVRATDVARAIRNAFKDEKVYAQVQFTVLRTYTIPAREGEMQAVDVDCKICLWDSESDSSMEINGLGTGADKGDKAMYKAQTGATKYALRNAFLIPDEADPEADSETDKMTEGAPPAQRGRPRTVSSAPAREGTSGTRATASSQSGQRPQRALDKALHTPPDAIGADPSHFQADDTSLPPEMFAPPEPETPETIADPPVMSTESDTSLVFEHGKLTEPYLTRAKEMLNTLTSIGLAASDKLPVGAKLKTYILAHSGTAIPQEKLTSKEFNAAFRDLDILLRDEGTKKHAVTMVDSKNDIPKKGKK